MSNAQLNIWHRVIHNIQEGKSIITSMVKIVRLAYRVIGFRAILLYIFEIIFGFLPVLNLLVIKFIIDNIQTPSNEIIMLAGLLSLVAINLISAAISSYSIILENEARDQIVNALKYDILRSASQYDGIAIYEDSDSQNNLVTASAASDNLWRSIESSFAFAGSITALISSMGVVLTISWWIPVILFLSVLPSILVKQNVERTTWNSEQLLSEKNRQREILQELIIEPRYARETRILGVSGLFLGRWQAINNDILNTISKVRRSGSRTIFLWSIPSVLTMIYPYYYILQKVTQGQIGIGQIVLYFGVIQDLRYNLITLFYNISDLTTAHHYITAIQGFIDTHKTGKNIGYATQSIQTIEFRNVTFFYPNKDQPALQNISFIFNQKEKVLIAGPNGSGKSTLLKLMLGLYIPQEGQVLINGKDISELDRNQLRQHFTGLFQDFARYPLSLNENITIGVPYQQEKYQQILNDVGILKWIQELPLQDNTPLDPSLSDGIDLSGGQWQRIAMARALYRLDHTEVCLFDEPTSAIDPLYENDLLSSILKHTHQRTLIVVGHRMSLGRHMSRILVLNEGKLIEEGSHQVLMNAQGMYAQMYNHQKSQFLDNESVSIEQQKLQQLFKESNS